MRAVAAVHYECVLKINPRPGEKASSCTRVMHPPANITRLWL